MHTEVEGGRVTKNYKKQEKTASQIAISVLSAEERKCGVGRPAAPAPSHLASASTGARSSPHPHPGAARRITSSRTQASAAPPLLCAAPSAPIRSIAEQFLQFLQSHVPEGASFASAVASVRLAVIAGKAARRAAQSAEVPPAAVAWHHCCSLCKRQGLP